MLRGLGHIPDVDADVEDDLRDRHVGSLIGASVGALPETVDYSYMLDAVQDQRNSQSCVGQAFSTTIFLRAKIAGHPIARPSAKGIWDLARLIDAPNHLSNIGCRPRAAIDGVESYGLVAEERWPLTDVNLDELPPLDVFRAGLGAMLAGYYRIGGGDIATLARSALAKGFIPFFAMSVDDGFMNMNDAGPYDGLTGPVRGGHAMALVGYDADTFLIANSWSTSWAAGGFARITDRALNTHGRDVIVCTTVPTQVS